MWMQKSVEGSSFSSSGNFHDRNRLGSQYMQGGSYSGGNTPHDAGDWKSKILESGQWLGGKVIEYGGKLARGPTTEAIPDHYAQQMPRNDGRANWMADIRSSSSSYAAGGGCGPGSYNGGYQNDFVTERPKAYSDYSQGYSSNPPGSYEPKSATSTDDHSHGKSRHAKKKKSEGKKSKKKSKKHKKKQQSESEEESEIEEPSNSESSEIESADERRHKKKVKAKKKKDAKRRDGFYSEESESESEGKHGTGKAAAADYSFSFDPAKLPPPPVEDSEKVTTKKAKAKKSKKDKSGKKSRARRHSIESTDDESASEKENSRKAKKRTSKKEAATASVDLLGVDLDVQPVAEPGTSGLEVQSSVFDAPQNQNPLQDLAGLSFTAPAQAPAPTQLSVSDSSAPAAPLHEAPVQSQSQSNVFQTNLLPENNIVDLSSLVSDKKKTLSTNPAEKRTLNDLQKARSTDQLTPVMAIPMHGQQQQNIPSSMMQLSQLHGVAGMQQQMYPGMQMAMQAQVQPQMMMIQQPQMAVMMQSQMMNMHMMQQQQFAQGGAAASSQPAKVLNSSSPDPFHQVP